MRTVGGDRVAATAHIQVVALGVLVVVEAVVQTAPAQGRACLVALAGVVVDHIHQHLQPRLMAGRHQLAHLLADLQGIVSLLVGVMGGHPAQRAVAPVVEAARRCVVGVEGHHRQQLHRGDAELPQVGNRLDQAQVGAAAFRAHRTAPAAAEAAHMQLVDDGALPAVARSGGRREIEAVTLGDHTLQAGGGVWCGAEGIDPPVDIPAGDGTGAGIEQQFGGVEAVAAGLQRAEHPIGVATPDADPFDLHMPVLAGAVVLAIEIHHLHRFRRAAVGEQQQLHPGGQWCRQGEIHPTRRGRCPQGPGLSQANRSQRSQRATATS